MKILSFGVLLSILILFTGFITHKTPVIIGNEPQFKLIAKADYHHYIISVYKNVLYKGKDLDILYKTNCLDTKTKTQREFFIKKTDNDLRSRTLAEFIMVEVLKGQNHTFPFGWETSNIELKDIRMNCISILEDKIKPVLE
ncbi:MAG: hypothetical protein K0S32_3718 [Bacteroidetes bacterium]|jgi:hypothetical protein|nr:hypothetical protein [Bacteroidota bacterium]